MLAAAAFAWAQDAAPADQGGWRRLGNPASAQPGPAPQGAPPQAQANGVTANDPPPPPPPLPATLTVAPGAYFTIRVNQPLSTEHNKVGDLFTASLAKPIIVNGVVVAERGETVAGRVAQVDKGGLLKGNSKLGIELTELTMSDGTQMPVRSQLISMVGPPSGGRNAAVVGTTTVVGAAIGGAADFGTGAAIGAGAGAAAGLIGVLAAHDRPALIPPEAVLTFRVEQPIVVSTEHAPQAFRYAGPGDYDQPPRFAARPGAPPPPYAAYYGPGYYPSYGPYYYGWGYPYYYPGVAIGFGWGRRWR